VIHVPSRFTGLAVAPDKTLLLYHVILNFDVEDGRGVAYCRIPPVLRGVTPIVHLWRIQRAVRNFLARRYQARTLALMMGLHERLGDLSLISTLPEDVLRCKVVGF
jgi:hypothetical protein